jgi:hypothetical protein
MFKVMLIGTVLLGLQAVSLSLSSPLANDAKALKRMIGDEGYTRLLLRLSAVNANIATKGIHDFPGLQDELISGYAFGEFYDLDLGKLPCAQRG